MATLSAKQINAIKNEILSKLGTVNQTLRLFESEYNTRLSDNAGGLTIEEAMAELGLKRPETVGKNGKVTKRRYQYADLAEAWSANLKTEAGEFCVMKSVTGTVEVPGDDDDEPSVLPVYTREEAEKELKSHNGRPVKRYLQRVVAKDKWSINTILTGLKQGYKWENEAKKYKRAKEAWDALTDDDLFVVVRTYDENDNELTAEIVSVAKCDVNFAK